MEEIRWYEKLNYTETKDIIKEKLQNMSRFCGNRILLEADQR